VPIPITFIQHNFHNVLKKSQNELRIHCKEISISYCTKWVEISENCTRK